MTFVIQQPQHLRDRLKRDTKNKEVIIIKRKPQHPRDRLKRMTEKLKFDAETWKEKPYIKIGVPVDSTQSENKIMDHLI